MCAALRSRHDGFVFVKGGARRTSGVYTRALGDRATTNEEYDIPRGSESIGFRIAGKRFATLRKTDLSRDETLRRYVVVLLQQSLGS